MKARRPAFSDSGKRISLNPGIICDSVAWLESHFELSLTLFKQECSLVLVDKIGLRTGNPVCELHDRERIGVACILRQRFAALFRFMSFFAKLPYG